MGSIWVIYIVPSNPGVIFELPPLLGGENGGVNWRKMVQLNHRWTNQNKSLPFISKMVHFHLFRNEIMNKNNFTQIYWLFTWLRDILSIETLEIHVTTLRKVKITLLRGGWWGGKRFFLIHRRKVNFSSRWSLQKC